MRRPSSQCLIVLFLAASYLTGEVSGQTPETPPRSADIDRLREAVAYWQATGKTPEWSPVNLAGLNFAWEVEAGGGQRLILVSRVHSGSLAYFSSDGGSLETIDTGEIYYSIALCDLDQDAKPELIIDEVEGFGTGYLDRRFRLFKLGETALLELGTLRSYSSAFMEERAGVQRRVVETGRLRCDPGDGMQSLGLDYSLERSGPQGTVRIERMRIVIERGRIVALPIED